MTHPTEPDLGPLTWIKTEIDLALARADESLEQALGTPDGRARVQFAQTHLHQTRGALSIVGLDGLTQFTSAVDRLLGMLARGERPIDAATIALARRALATIGNYLEELVHGTPDQPLRLFSLYEEISAACGADAVSPAELFFPDLSLRPPRRKTTGSELGGGARERRLRSGRTQFQRGLLAWLRRPDDTTGPRLMLEAVGGVEALHTGTSVGALWCAAEAFLEAVVHGDVPARVEIGRLCRQLDAQWKRLSASPAVVPERLISELLYWTSQAPARTPQQRSVRAIWQLDTLIPESGAAVSATPLATLLKTLQGLMSTVKHAWNGFTNGHASELPRFESELAALSDQASNLGRPVLDRLLQGITSFTQWLRKDPLRCDDPIALEVATALLLTEAGLDRGAPDAGFAAQVDDTVARLDALKRGETVQPAENSTTVETARRTQEREALGQLSREVLSSLAHVEQVLDDFFRNQQKRSPLANLAKPLKQIEGALKLIGDADAITLVDAAARTVARMAEADAETDRDEFEKLARDLSALGFYVEALRHGPTTLERFLDPQDARRRSAAEEVAVAEAEPADAAFETTSEPPVDPEVIREAAAEHAAEPTAGDTDGYRFEYEPVAEHDEDDTTASPAAATAGVAEAPIAPPAPITRGKADIDAELLGIFIEEAHEVLAAVGEKLELSRGEPEATDHLINIRRGFHTLKGSGRMVGLRDLGEAAWGMEQTLNRWLQLEWTPTPALHRLIETAQETFCAWVAELEAGGDEARDVTTLMAEAERLRSSDVPIADAAAIIPAAHAPVADVTADVAVVDADDATRPPAAPDTVETSLEVFDVADRERDESQAYPEPAGEPDFLLEETSLDGLSPVDTLDAFDVFELDEAFAAGDGAAGTGDSADAAAPPRAEHRPPREREEADEAVTVSSPPPAAEEEEEEALGGLEIESAVFDFGDLPDGTVSHPTSSPFDGAAHEVPLSGSIVRTDTDEEQIARVAPADVEKPAEEPGPAVESGPTVELEPVVQPEPTAEFDSAIGLEAAHASEADEAPQAGHVAAAAETATDLRDDVPAAGDLVRVGAAEVSRPLYDLYLGEARHHLAVLHAEIKRLEDNPTLIPAEKSLRAAHTLAGISGTTRLAPLHELARGLEHAIERLRERLQVPAAEQVALLKTTNDTLEAMLAEVSVRKMPLAVPELIEQLAAVGSDQWLETEPEPAHDDSPGAAPIAPPVETTPMRAEPAAPVHDDLDPQLLPIFLEEGAELLGQLHATLRTWRGGGDAAAATHAIARLFHTLKGSARMAGAMTLGEHVHQLESRLVSALEAEEEPAGLIDELVAGLDVAQQMIDMVADGGEASMPTSRPTGEGTEAAPATPGPTAAADHEAGSGAASLRVRADTVDRFVNQAGEIGIARTRAAGELRTLRRSMLDLTENVIRLRNQLREVEIQADVQMQSRIAHTGARDGDFDPLEMDRYTRLQELTRMMAESVGDVTTIQQSLLRTLDGAEVALNSQARMSRELQQALMQVRMVPFDSLTDRLYRVLRQTGKELGKRANLDVRGGRIEIDRGVLEHMTAPLEHLLRNAIAHGIETPAQRRAAGKEEIGQITLSVSQEAGEIAIALTDDGGGLDYGRIAERARANGLLDANEAADERRLTNLIFVPGFSTAGTLSSVSGRGVGMDVVKSETAAVGGRIDVHAVAGQGTEFRIHLPLTLAVTQALLIRAGGRTYAIPSSMIAQVLELKADALDALIRDGGAEWQGERFAYRYLPRLLGDAASQSDAQRFSWVLLLRAGAQTVALHVDALRGNQEIVVKNAGPQLARIVGVSGATVLGNGEIVLILNPVALASRGLAEEVPTGAIQQTEPATPARQPTIMVVDDSLTVRKITGRLLEREGFRVVTAKDGVDALERLLDAVPDAILSDIEMPRMDGFDLLRNIRADERTRAVPVIMITSRLADKHREYARSIGADHYLGKPYDETELLALLRSYTERRRAVA